jgi:hypothetical protein
MEASKLPQNINQKRTTIGGNLAILNSSFGFKDISLLKKVSKNRQSLLYCNKKA